MKKIVLLFAVGFSVVSCGKKGWDAASEKKFMDECNVGGALTAMCECNMKVYKDAGIAPDKVATNSDLGIITKLGACAMSGLGNLGSELNNALNSASTALDTTAHTTTPAGH